MPRLSDRVRLHGNCSSAYLDGMKTIQMTIIGLMAVCGFNLTAGAKQPYMRRALEHLRAIRAELQAAENNNGGWIRTIENTDRAIRETENGMAAARYRSRRRFCKRGARERGLRF